MYKDETKYHVKTGPSGDREGEGSNYDEFVGVETRVQSGLTFGPRRQPDENHTLQIYPGDKGKLFSASYANPEYP